MPFTLSHPAAVIGLRRAGLPMVGLVAGSMVPDLPMFGIVPYGYARSHSLVGLITVDVAAGTAAVLIWVLLVRGVLVDASPSQLRARLSEERLTRRQWLLVPLAVVVGAVTHVVWDAFTHEGRWGFRHIGWLRADHLGYAGYHWAQAGSSTLGLIVLAVYTAPIVGRRRPRPRPTVAAAFARWALGAVVCVAAVVGVGYAASNLGSGLHAAAFAAAVHSLPALAIGLVIGGAGWRLVAARHRPRACG